MTTTYPFDHDGPVFLVSDDKYEVIYYSRDYCKFKRVRRPQFESFEDVDEQSIDRDEFWMVVRCIQRRKLYAT